MRIYISNRLEVLAESLRGVLACQGGSLDKKWVVVPNKKRGNDLFPQCEGVISWDEAWNKIFPNIPSVMELSFWIEKGLSEVEEERVVSYLREGGEANHV